MHTQHWEPADGSCTQRLRAEYIIKALATKKIRCDGKTLGISYTDRVTKETNSFPRGT